MTLSRSCTSCAILIFITSVFSCHKKNIVGPMGPEGPQGPDGTIFAARGDIRGKVALYDIFGQPLAAFGGATVSLDNTSPALQATTTDDGSFTLPSVHEGVYNLTIRKDGYGTMRYFNISHSGTASATQIGFLTMGQQMPSQYDIKQLKVDSAFQHAIGNYLEFTVILVHPQRVSNPVLLYFNDSTGVGEFKYKYVFEVPFFQQDDTTLVFSPFDNHFSDFSDKLGKADYIYVSASIDNAKRITYTDENHIAVYPAAGKASPEVIVNNILHKY